MEEYGLIGSIIFGILAGLVAHKIVGKEGTGCWWNLFLGIVGGFVGGWVFDLLHITWGGLIAQFVAAIVGAVILLTIFSFFKKK